jgi:hypothetical protein
LGNLDGLFNNTAQLSLLSLYCGKDYSNIQTILTQLDQLVGFLLEAASRVLELVSCTTVVPLYVNTVYEGMCTYSPEAVYWIFKVRKDLVGSAAVSYASLVTSKHSHLSISRYSVRW